EGAAGSRAEQQVTAVETERPVALTHRTRQQRVDRVHQRLVPGAPPEGKPYPRHEHMGDGVVITLMVIVNPTDTLIVAPDDSRDPGIDIDVGPVADQPQSRGQMRFMSPVCFGERTRKKA